MRLKQFTYLNKQCLGGVWLGRWTYSQDVTSLTPGQVVTTLKIDGLWPGIPSRTI